MKRLFVVFLLLACVGVVSADTLIVYTTNTTDGNVYRIQVNATFQDIRDGTGTGYSGTGTTVSSYIQSDLLTDRYSRLYRSPFIFDTSEIPDTATLNSALVALYRFGNYTQLGDTGLNIVAFTIDGTLDSADYDNFGTIRFSTDQNASTITTAKYYNWSLNADGLAAISKTGNTGLGSRFGFDIENISPTWISGGSKISGAAWRSADYVLYPPLIQIEYTPADTTPPDSITNLAYDNTTCQNVTWTWDNPSDSDYDYLYVLKNNVWHSNVSNASEVLVWAGLTAGEFASRTMDLSGNMNDTWVNGTAETFACDETPPLAPINLANVTTCNSINWTWEAADEDYHMAIVYRTDEGDPLGDYFYEFVIEPDFHSLWTGLSEDTDYTISIKSSDGGNVNDTWVNLTSNTGFCAVPTPAPTVAEDWEACFPWCGIQEIFFWNESSDVSGYRILDHMPEKSVQREVNVTVSAATGSLELGAWVSPDGSPGVTTIAPGMWRFRTYHNVSSQVGITTLEFHIVNRSSAGTETDLFYGNAITKDINTLDPAEQLLSYARRNATTMFDGDRLVIKVNASTTSVTARKVYMWLGGNTNTSMVQASNFICCEGGGCNTGSEGIAILFGVVGGILGAIAILRRRGEAP